MVTKKGAALDAGIVLILGQDGVSSGAIYALLALALVLIFSVTRVIFIPQGEFVAFGALTLAMLQAGKVPATVWLLVAMGAVVAVVDGLARLRDRDTEGLGSLLGWNLAYPLALAALLHAVEPGGLPMALQILLTLAILVPLGPMIYRIAYQPIAETSVLVLLIASVAVHLILTGLGLVFFGAEGARTRRSRRAASLRRGVDQPADAVGGGLLAGLHRRAGGLLHAQPVRQGAAGHRGEPSGAKLMGISPVVAGKLTFCWRRCWGVLRGADRADHHHLLRHGLPDRPEGLRRGDHRRAGELPAGGGRRGAGGAAGILLVVLGQRLQGGAGVHADHPGAPVALLQQSSRGG
jgi:branched-chain amino acid transport system permease protein